MDVKTIFVCYLSIMNLWGFFIMGLDKLRSKVLAWRLLECSLFLVFIFVCSLCSIAGMSLFLLITKHFTFLIGILAIFLIQLVGCFLIFLSILK